MYSKCRDSSDLQAVLQVQATGTIKSLLFLPQKQHRADGHPKHVDGFEKKLLIISSTAVTVILLSGSIVFGLVVVSLYVKVHSCDAHEKRGFSSVRLTYGVHS